MTTTDTGPQTARTADDVLNEDYTYVDPKFAHAFREGWKAGEAEARRLTVERIRAKVLALHPATPSEVATILAQEETRA